MLAALAAGLPGVLTYGITPPKRSWSPDKVVEVAATQAARIRELPVDGVVVYDLQDESSRTDVERPFPYEEPLDPVAYAYDMLGDVGVPRIVYRCVARLGASDLRGSLDRIRDEGGATVLVGAASKQQDTAMRLSEAYELRRDGHDEVPTGGVLIGERHRRAHTEHLRVLSKVDAGCSFFVTQAVYSATDTLDVLSDLHVRCEELGRRAPSVLVTLTPCGSARTLGFLEWLGIEVPRWLRNEMLRADDTLQASVDACVRVLAELAAYAADHDVPLGCNVESVSLRRDEVEASVELVHRAREVLDAV